MSCCGNHCFSTYHPEVKLIDGNKYIEVCFPNKRRRLCVIKDIKGKTIADKINAYWKTEKPNDKRNPHNPDLWVIWNPHNKNINNEFAMMVSRNN